MNHPIRLIVGLANPGNEYADTRHNAGAWFLEHVTHMLHASFKNDRKFHGFYAIGKHHHETIHCLIPSTYMNKSGLAVHALMQYHKIPTNHVLVAHDDLDLPVGSVRLKWDGGDGGHNGLRDIIRHLGSKQFYRCRIGIGRPSAGSSDVVDYVLHKPSKSERLAIDKGIERAANALDLLFDGYIARAMNLINTETP